MKRILMSGGKNGKAIIVTKTQRTKFDPIIKIIKRLASKETLKLFLVKKVKPKADTNSRISKNKLFIRESKETWLPTPIEM